MILKSIVTSITIASIATFGHTSKAYAQNDIDKLMGLLFFGAVAAKLIDDNKKKEKAIATNKQTHQDQGRYHKHRNDGGHKHPHSGRHRHHRYEESHAQRKVRKHKGRKIHQGVRHKHGNYGYHYHKHPHRIQKRRYGH